MRWMFIGILGLTFITTVRADDDSTGMEAELASFESDISSMGRRLAAPIAGNNSSCGKLTYSAELTLLRIYGADRVMVGDDNDVASQETGKAIRYGSLDAGFRTSLDYKTCNGCGIRGSYFRLSSNADLLTSTIPGDSDTVEGRSGETRFETFDLALTQRANFRAWSFLVAGGVRGGRFKTNSVIALEDGGGAPVNDYVISTANSFEGWGPSFALEAKRPAFRRLHFFTNANTSLLFGNIKESFTDVTNDGGPASLASVASIVPVIETQIGAEWNHCVGRGLFTVSSAFEAQGWLGVGGGPDTNVDPGGNNIDADGTPVGMQDDLGLIGITFAAGYQF